ncbi:PIN domain-containing protein [Streptomyces zaomyceticus]|uniref:PIN domain-containing protein n=1 Tax=Streptomyces zaomyceticus TaxID=68286 RepID=UPI003694137B
MDTNILYKKPLDSVTTDLLKTIRTSGGEGVAIPSVVLEELVAHRAVPYRERYESLSANLKSHLESTPWHAPTHLYPIDLERFQEHWRDKYREFLDVLPASVDTLEEAVRREANVLPPCKRVTISEGGEEAKIGGRDAAIWLTAIEYARTHTEETVYFVSKNTKDFGAGASYPYPMDRDVLGLGERFVHLTSIQAVIAKFAEETEIDHDSLLTLLSGSDTAELVGEEALRLMPYDYHPRYSVPHLVRFNSTATDAADIMTRTVTAENTLPFAAEGWMARPGARFDSVRDVKAYRIRDHVWCTATARWLLRGLAFSPRRPSVTSVGCAWETRVLISLSESGAQPTLLRSDPPRAISAEEMNSVPEGINPPEFGPRRRGMSPRHERFLRRMSESVQEGFLLDWGHSPARIYEEQDEE